MFRFSRFKSDIKKVMSVEGQLKEEEAKCLMKNANQVKKEGVIVEIGSYRGRSTCALALGSKGRQVAIYAIDPQEEFVGEYGGIYGKDDRKEFFKNILKLDLVNRVRLINLQSQDVSKCWESSIDLLWIDGDHRYEEVREDLFCWSKFVKPEGLIALHDSLNPDQGPYKAIRDLIKADKSFRIVDQVLSITLVEKRY